MSLDSINSKPNYNKLEQAKQFKSTEKTEAKEILEKSKSGEPIKMDDGSWGPKDTTKEIGKLGKAQTSISIDHGGCEIGVLHKIYANHDPKTIVEGVRNSKGADHDNALLGFKDKVDNLSNNELKDMRDYIGQEMSSPKNNDDELLGSMLKVVNKEIDSRDQKPDFGGIVEPYEPKPIYPWNEKVGKPGIYEEKINIKNDPFGKINISGDQLQDIKEKMKKLE